MVFSIRTLAAHLICFGQKTVHNTLSHTHGRAQDFVSHLIECDLHCCNHRCLCSVSHTCVCVCVVWCVCVQIIKLVTRGRECWVMRSEQTQHWLRFILAVSDDDATHTDNMCQHFYINVVHDRTGTRINWFDTHRTHTHTQPIISHNTRRIDSVMKTTSCSHLNRETRASTIHDTRW